MIDINLYLNLIFIKVWFFTTLQSVCVRKYKWSYNVVAVFYFLPKPCLYVVVMVDQFVLCCTALFVKLNISWDNCEYYLDRIQIYCLVKLRNNFEFIFTFISIHSYHVTISKKNFEVLLITAQSTISFFSPSSKNLNIPKYVKFFNLLFDDIYNLTQPVKHISSLEKAYFYIPWQLTEKILVKTKLLNQKSNNNRA